jgi:hypothetical protein
MFDMLTRRAAKDGAQAAQPAGNNTAAITAAHTPYSTIDHSVPSNACCCVVCSAPSSCIKDASLFVMTAACTQSLETGNPCAIAPLASCMNSTAGGTSHQSTYMRACIVVDISIPPTTTAVQQLQQCDIMYE